MRLKWHPPEEAARLGGLSASEPETMSPRSTFLATTLALGLLAGCSSNTRTTPPAEPSAAESGGTPTPSAAAPDTSAQKLPTQPLEESGGTAAPAPAADAKPVVYYVKDSGVRCMAAPCPSYIATRADKPDAEGIPITDLDLGALGVGEEQSAKLLDSTHNGTRGLKVEATVIKVPNAGPAGDGTRLSVNRVLEGK